MNAVMDDNDNDGNSNNHNRNHNHHVLHIVYFKYAFHMCWFSYDDYHSL